MHHLVYAIENLLNGMLYVGKHSTENIQDNYMGSGQFIGRVIKKHGVENFRKHILIDCEREEDAWWIESRLVDEDWVTQDWNYNLCVGGEIGMRWTDPEYRRRQAEGAARSWKDPEFVKRYVEGCRRRRANDADFRERHANRLRNRNRSAEGRSKSSETLKRTWTDEKNRNSILSKWQDPEFRKRQSEAARAAGKAKAGRRWIHDPISQQTKMVTQEDADRLINAGWVPGRI